MFIDKLAYEASAGSGKTFNLVVRYLSLLFLGATPSKVLALTFTNKAAYEMQERIVSTLEELENKEELNVISEVTGIHKEELLAKKAVVLEQFLSADVKIMTLDKFFAKVLRKFSLYAGLMPNFTTYSAQHEQKLLNRFLDEVSVTSKEEKLVDIALMMDKRVSDIFGLLGELYSKLSEIKHLHFTHIPHGQYEKKALDALENIRRIVLTCKDASTTVKNAVDAENMEELLTKKWLERDTLNYSTFKKCYTPAMDDELEAIKENVLLYMRSKEESFFHALYELVNSYVKSKKALAKEIGELGFEDISSLVHELLTTRIESEFLYFRLDAKIEHILLDEFQDTSIMQYEILRPLIKEITSGQGLHENGSFFFVGDVKQSIYRFRGGVSALFDFVKKDNDVTVEPLLVNYRSQKEVVEFVNELFRNKIQGYKDQRVRESANGGYVEVLQCEEILEVTKEKVELLLELGADANEVAVLTSTNDDANAIEELLKESGIEVISEATTKLMNQDVVRALIEYIKYLYFKEDIYRHNFFALINKEVAEIALVDVRKLTLGEIVKDAVTRYGLYDGEFHVLRFMKTLENYADIEQFIFEYERDETAAAASDLQGVRILTVHKSKGLEYDHVVVMDRLKKAPPPRNPIIYEYEGIRLKNIYLRMKGRNLLDPVYAEALEKEKALVLEDRLNALYVAFTRAKENLFVIAKEKDSVFEPIELTLMQRGSLHVKPKERSAETANEPLFYKSLRCGVQTDILAQDKEDETDHKAINFGLGLHYYLQMMHSFTHEAADEAYDVLLNRYGSILEAEELLDIQNRVKMLLEDEQFLKLSNGECFKEKGMLVGSQLRFMDLLVKTEEESYNIIDYKSAYNYSDKYEKQVKEYKEAVLGITQKSVRGYLCYLLSDRVMTKEVK